MGIILRIFALSNLLVYLSAAGASDIKAGNSSWRGHPWPQAQKTIILYRNLYLRPWLSKTDRKLVEYGRVPPTMEIRSRRWVTQKTGRVSNLYTLPGATEETKQNVERIFNQEVDTSDAKVRDKLLRAEPLTDKEKYEWARFLLWLGMRNPAEMAKFKERMKRGYSRPDAKTEEIWRRIRKDGMPETAEEALRQANPDMPELSAIIVSTRLAEKREVLDTLVRIDWMVTDVQTANRRLLTCDRPLIMTSGLGGPNGHVAIPISPDKLFTIAKTRFNDALSMAAPHAVVGRDKQGHHRPGAGQGLWGRSHLSGRSEGKHEQWRVLFAGDGAYASSSSTHDKPFSSRCRLKAASSSFTAPSDLK
ncbi:DUF4238 domain-containing protein [Rhizobium laguerreae]|uniref:DUF4238 domain-containing protein n=1 Tax=Rhizobium laguerreae TaxID=1076926 RepID=UPI001C9118DA|nr:DUF4238 domain-containing protein [Rhizobium laguerreae]MBY3171633.1 DUF4238 domain-containing protein [Rhizobium laguerreae]